jgi:hypothetical protein
MSQTKIPTWLTAGLLAVTASGAALVVPLPARAETDAREVSYATTTQSRTVETFSRLPLYVTQGAPSSTVFLDHQSVPICEVVAGLFDGQAVEEYIELGAGGTYNNPTKVKAGQGRGALPQKAEFGTAPGPTARAACPSAESGTGQATAGGIVSDQLTVATATTNSTATSADGRDVVSEAVTNLQGVKLADVSIRQLESWLKVEWRPEVEPLISYRLVLSGLFNGADAVLLNGERGIVLQGRDLAGSEFVKQFNQQSKANEKALEQIGTYGFRVLEPSVYQDASGRHVIENFVVNAGFGFAARKNELGNFQGMRLAAATVTGRIAYFAS